MAHSLADWDLNVASPVIEWLVRPRVQNQFLTTLPTARMPVTVNAD